MDRFFYSGALIVFLTPLVYVIFSKYWRTVKKRKKFIAVMAIVGFLSFLLMMPIAAYWGAWHYDYSKTLDIRIGYEVLETWIWQIISCMLLAVVVDHFAEIEERKRKRK